MKKTVTFSVLLAFLSIWDAGEAFASSGPDRRAMLLSFIVPGLGQYYSGSPGYAKLFFASELAIWGTYYYNAKMKNSKRQDYLSFAARHAGTYPGGHGTPYLNALGTFNSSFDYNGHQLTRGNPLLYTGLMEWNWDSELHRLRFRQLRENELGYENNLKYCFAGAALNHLLSALHASKRPRNDEPSSAVSIQAIDRGLLAIYARSY